MLKLCLGKILFANPFLLHVHSVMSHHKTKTRAKSGLVTKRIERIRSYLMCIDTFRLVFCLRTNKCFNIGEFDNDKI